VENNLWGTTGASGSQCTTFSSSSGTSVAWSSTWSWDKASGGVKSYANADVVNGKNKQLSAIGTIPSVWSWNYNSGVQVGDVAYDIWTSASPSGAHAYEIMIWLAAYGDAQPISYNYNSSGKAVPIASSITIGSYRFALYAGSNSDWTVYSFIASSTVTSFSGDVKAFFTYLINNGHIASSQYLVQLQAGIEATVGSNAVFTVDKYSAVIN